MKKIVSLLLVLCFCVGLAACGKSSAASASPSASSASPSAASAPASSPAPTAEPKAEPTPVPFSIQELVDALNAEELAQRTEEDPYIAVFEVAAEANTINYKLAMDYFQYVISTAIGGEAEFIDAYNRILTSIPPIENSLESMIHETQPDLNVVVIVMNDSFSTEVAAVIDNGEIIYDVVNGVGTAPKDITPIIVPKELSPEMQAELDEFKNALNSDNG